MTDELPADPTDWDLAERDEALERGDLDDTEDPSEVVVGEDE